MIKAAILALAVPAMARELMPAQRHLLTSEADILAAVPTLESYCRWVNSYIRATHPGVIQRLEADSVDYSNTDINDGGGDLYDSGNEIILRFKDGKSDTPLLKYSRQNGPKVGALVTGSSIAGDHTLDFAQIYKSNVFAGVYKSTGGGTFDQFRVGGEMGSTGDFNFEGSGSLTFNSVDYEYFWIARQYPGYKGKFDMVVINSADGGIHCLGERCNRSDYDYHRVIDQTDGFDKAGYTLFALYDGDDYHSTEWLSNGEGPAAASEMAMYMAATMQNLL